MAASPRRKHKYKSFHRSLITDYSERPLACVPRSLNRTNLHNISRPVSRPVPDSARMYPQPGGRWSTFLRSVVQGSQGDLVQEFNMEANVACPSPVRRPPEPLSERSYDPLPTRFLPQPNTSSDAWSFKTTSYNAHKAMFAPHATLRRCTDQAGAPLRTHYSRLS